MDCNCCCWSRSCCMLSLSHPVSINTQYFLSALSSFLTQLFQNDYQWIKIDVIFSFFLSFFIYLFIYFLPLPFLKNKFLSFFTFFVSLFLSFIGFVFIHRLLPFFTSCFVFFFFVFLFCLPSFSFCIFYTSYSFFLSVKVMNGNMEEEKNFKNFKISIKRKKKKR